MNFQFDGLMLYFLLQFNLLSYFSIYKCMGETHNKHKNH